MKKKTIKMIQDWRWTCNSDEELARFMRDLGIGSVKSCLILIAEAMAEYNTEKEKPAQEFDFVDLAHIQDFLKNTEYWRKKGNAAAYSVDRMKE